MVKTKWRFVGFWFFILSLWPTEPKANNLDDMIAIILGIIAHQKHTDDFSSFMIGVANDVTMSNSSSKIVRRIKANRDIRIKGKPIDSKTIDFKNTEDLKTELQAGNIQAIFFPKELPAETITRVLTITRPKSILSIVENPDHLYEVNASLGVERKGRKHVILINKNGIEAERVNFDSRLIRMAAKRY